MDRMQGLSAIPTQERKIQHRKGSPSRDKSEQKKKAVSANQMDNQQVKRYLRRTMFQQKKRAEDLANSMDVRNTALEKLRYKVIDS